MSFSWLEFFRTAQWCKSQAMSSFLQLLDWFVLPYISASWWFQFDLERPHKLAMQDKRKKQFFTTGGFTVVEQWRLLRVQWRQSAWLRSLGLRWAWLVILQMTESKKERNVLLSFFWVFFFPTSKEEKRCGIWLTSSKSTSGFFNTVFDAACSDISGLALRPISPSCCTVDRWCEGGGSSENVGHQISGTDSKCCRAAICWGYQRGRIAHCRYMCWKKPHWLMLWVKGISRRAEPFASLTLRRSFLPSCQCEYRTRL